MAAARNGDSLLDMVLIFTGLLGVHSTDLLEGGVVDGYSLNLYFISVWQFSRL